MIIQASILLALLWLACTYFIFKKHRLRHLLLALSLMALGAFGLTYGKWEYLTYRHLEEMKAVAVEEMRKASLPILTVSTADDIALLKVFSWSEHSAKLMFKDIEGNKWTMELVRDDKAGPWTAYRDGSWQIDMIHSELGGSARRLFYWY